MFHLTEQCATEHTCCEQNVTAETGIQETKVYTVPSHFMAFGCTRSADSGSGSGAHRRWYTAHRTLRSLQLAITPHRGEDKGGERSGSFSGRLAPAVMQRQALREHSSEGLGN